MSAERTLLQARCALDRRRLARQVGDLRGRIRAPRISAVPVPLRLAFGLALAVAGAGRIARILAFAGRALLVARLVRSLTYRKSPI